MFSDHVSSSDRSQSSSNSSDTNTLLLSQFLFLASLKASAFTSLAHISSFSFCTLIPLFFSFASSNTHKKFFSLNNEQKCFIYIYFLKPKKLILTYFCTIRSSCFASFLRQSLPYCLLPKKLPKGQKQ